MGPPVTAAESRPLLDRIADIRRQPPAGVEPWRAGDIEKAIERAQRYEADQAAFNLEFIESIQDLVDDAEISILKRFGLQSLLTEARIQADDPTVRDHLRHVTQVFLIGWAILNGCRLFSAAGDEWRPYDWPLTGKERFEALNRAWLFAALLHDSGYSVEYGHRAWALDRYPRELFGDMYRPLRAGGPVPGAMERASEPIWRLRNRWQGRLGALPAAVRGEVDSQYQRADHGMLAGAALWREAERWPGEDTRRPLRAAAVAAWLHNWIKHGCDCDRGPRDQPNAWLALDLQREPLSVLLLLCDELQEWGRERRDVEFSRRRGVQEHRYAGSDLMRLEIDDVAGLSLEVELRHRLRSEDRRRQKRFIQQAERDIANKRRWSRLLLPGRDDDSPWQVHLRVEEWVEHRKCNTTWEIGWQRSAAADLDRIETQLDRQTASLPGDPLPMQVELERDEESHRAGALIRFENNRARPDIHAVPQDRGLRLVVTGQGARGKSTLLQAMALSAAESRPARRAIYIEQLQDELIDLTLALERLHQAEPGREILLLVDHLDRLVEDASREYWLDQLAELPAWPWLHVVTACRPDEYDRFIRGPLSKRYGDARLLPESPAAASGVSLDDEGRVLPGSVLGNLQAERRAFELACRLALSFGQHRSRTLSGEEVRRLADVKYRGEALLLVDEKSGRVRFVHDVVQDALTAAELARQLDHHRQDPEQTSLLITELMHLPRDVPRMLFDLVSERRLKRKHLSADQLKGAAAGLAKGFAHDIFMRQWINDSGRLNMAMEAFERYDKTRTDSEEARLVADSMLAHGLYMRCKIQDLMHRSRGRQQVAEFAEPGIERMKSVALNAEAALEQLADCPQEDFRRSCYMNHLVFAIDHLLMLLRRIRGTPHLSDKGRELIRDTAGRFDGPADAAPFERGWLKGLFDQLVRQSASNQTREVHTRFQQDIAKAVAANPDARLEARLCYATGHIATAFVEEAHGRVPRPPQLESLEEGRRWAYRAMAHWERLHRKTFNPQVGIRQLQIGSETHLLANLGVACRGVAETTIFELACADPKPGLIERILLAHENLRDAWKRVSNRLESAEKLPVHYNTVVPVFISGEFVKEITENRIEPDEAECILSQVAEEESEYVSANAERHPRERGKEIEDPVTLWREPRKILGEPGVVSNVLKTITESERNTS